MFPVTISKLQLCFETISAAVGVHKNALSAFQPSETICYFPVIFSLASSHKASYSTEPQAGLCPCIHPTQELWYSTELPGMLSSARALCSVLWVGFSELPRAGLQFGYFDELSE